MEKIERINDIEKYFTNFDLDEKLSVISVSVKTWHQSKPGGDDRWGVGYYLHGDDLRDGYFTLENNVKLYSYGWSSSGYSSGYDEVYGIEERELHIANELKDEMIDKIRATYSRSDHISVIAAINELDDESLVALNLLGQIVVSRRFIDEIRILSDKRVLLLCGSVNLGESVKFDSFMRIINHPIFRKYVPPKIMGERIEVNAFICKNCKFIKNAEQDGWFVYKHDTGMVYKTFDLMLRKWVKKEEVIEFVRNNSYMVPCYMQYK